MKIIVINGSPRTNGLTAAMLHRLADSLLQKGADVQYYDLSLLNIKQCRGCCACYRTGHCIFQDDAERLSDEITKADGIVIGSPTYVSNVSGLLKIFIDRGHFVIEQLLRGKYAVGIVTGENYGSRDTARVLNRLFSYSGASVSDTVICNAPFSSKQFPADRVVRAAERQYEDIARRRIYPLQAAKHRVIFRFGILPFVRQKGAQYQGVTDRWRTCGFTK